MSKIKLKTPGTGMIIISCLLQQKLKKYHSFLLKKRAYKTLQKLYGKFEEILHDTALLNIIISAEVSYL